MRHRFILCLVVLIWLLSFCLPASAEDEVPAAWDLTFETDDVLAAAKEACLIFGGQGYWENGRVQTVGIVVLEQTIGCAGSEQHDANEMIELSLYTARCVFDISSGTPEYIAGGLKPFKLVFERTGDGYRLLSYQKPEDGTENAASTKRIFGEALYQDIAKRQFDYAELASQDAADDAEAYIRYLQTGEKTDVWYEFLPSGTEPDAAQIVLSSVAGGYPSYTGMSAGYRAGKLYTLSVEGEQSYSGRLTFSCFDAIGNQLESFSVQVVDGRLQVLDGELPELVYE